MIHSVATSDSESRSKSLQARKRASGSFVVETLESRRFFSVTTAAPLADVTGLTVTRQLVAAATVSDASTLTLADRQQLAANWRGPGYQNLIDLAAQGKTAEFDQTLLDYMVQRTNVKYYYDINDLPSYIDDLQNTNLDLQTIINHADQILKHIFPEQGSTATYAVQLPSKINWLKQPTTTTNPTFLHSLNRMTFWRDLSTAYRLTDDPKYITELKKQLNSWAAQNPPLLKPDDWRKSDPKWWLLDAATRGETWTDVYFQVLGTPGWTPAINTLFLSRIWQHGDFLRRVTPKPLDDNWTQFHATGLLLIAQLFPEFKSSADWNTYGRNLLFKSFDAQFYNDGGHVEESLTYQGTVLDNVLNRYRLDQLNGVKWVSSRVRKLKNAVESFYQLLSPNGATPALSDSYRSPSRPFFTKAALFLNDSRWPVSRPRPVNIFTLGPEFLDDTLAAPGTPDLAGRGLAYAMKQSGYYVMRSGDDPNARQLIFDAGPKGGPHGHSDLLNFELFGNGRTLIADPGLLKYDTSADRAWVISTPAHNTISIDGKSHADLEGPTNPGFKVDLWDVAADHIQVTAHHFGYKALAGAPAVGRSIWFDKDSTFLVVDWGKSTTNHTYTSSFNIPGTAVTAIQGNAIRSTNADSNVKIAPLLLTGQTLKREARFTSSSPPPHEKDPAIRFTVNQTGKNAIIATLVTTYAGTTPPNITAQFVSKPVLGQPVHIKLTKNGVSQEIVFQPPNLIPPA